jgi:serine phosphatase RsbU (regulator of sigma subunit)
MLLAITDGYFETEGTGGEQWQQERAETLVRSMRDASPEAILKACNEAMRTWSAGAPAADDRTAIILKRLG